MSLRETLSTHWRRIQGELFPFLEDEVGPLTVWHKQIVTVLDVVRIEMFVRSWPGLVGRPLSERAALARAFVAKAVMNLPTTRALIERMEADKTLRRLCGWERLAEIPSESTFSRAFAAFAASALPSLLHERLILDTHAERLVGHISRDSTAIQGREAPCKDKTKTPAAPISKPKKKRGRPKKGEQRQEEDAKTQRRIAAQAAGKSLADMLADLPRNCDFGCKRNAKGRQESWIGYKLHIDTADGDIPISCVLTSASLHDSQAAIPLATMTAARVTSCYDLMDSAYDVAEIKDHSRSLGHVPIIDTNPRRNTALKDELAAERKRLKRLGHHMAEDIRYNERSAAERVNSALKDNHGGNTVRVRGPEKVMCHLMFGILTIAVTQIFRLLT